MGFINETKKALNLKGNFSNLTSCNVIFNHGATIEGFKKIHELSDQKILALCHENKKIEILGSNLKISEMSFKELIIEGKISSINFLEN